MLTRVLLPLLLAGLTLPAAGRAQARRTTKAQTPEEEPTLRASLADLKEIVPRLKSENPDEVREAIDLLSVIDHPKVVPHLADLLRSGQPDPITDRALDALKGLAHRSAIDVLTEFTSHRRAGARRRAYLALAVIDDKRVPALLAQGLRDPDRNVRAAAALELGNIGARGSLDVLFQAFEAGVIEAGISIGKLGDDRAAERFTKHLGQRPLSVMLSGYREFLKRDHISKKTKAEIVTQLGEVSGSMVRQFLQRYLDTFPTTRLKRRRVQDLIDHVEKTLRRIPIEAAGGAQ